MSSFADTGDLLGHLIGELDNFEQIAQYLLPEPGDLPRLHGVDVFGGTLALNGTIGGDHIIYVDFKQRFNLPARIEDAVARGRFDIAEQLRRCQRMAGDLLFRGSGHRVTDPLLAPVLHPAVLPRAVDEAALFRRSASRPVESPHPP